MFSNQAETADLFMLSICMSAAAAAAAAYTNRTDTFRFSAELLDVCVSWIHRVPGVL